MSYQPIYILILLLENTKENHINKANNKAHLLTLYTETKKKPKVHIPGSESLDLANILNVHLDWCQPLSEKKICTLSKW